MEKKKVEEWSASNKWNPFNSYKLLAQVYRWRRIKRGERIPQPALVTVDPVNICDLRCIWCNADYVLKTRTGTMSKTLLMNIAQFLSEWKACDDWEEGVEAVCIAGGGEPLIAPAIGDFIDSLVEKGVEVGVVTNGTLIDKYIEPLSKCTWVGVSVDAGCRETFQKIKQKDVFDKVIENMKQLIIYATTNKTRLGSPNPGYGVSYKYLYHPYNVHEIVDAVRIAKNIGCKNFHSRPMGVPWDKLGQTKPDIFPDGIPTEFQKQIGEARKYEDSDFGVYGITHKFNEVFNRANYFETCHAIFMTFVLSPSTDGNGNHFQLELCCDRRGDTRLELGNNLNNVEEIKSLWGSRKHWEIFDSINLADCPRCTYQPHNQIFENVIKDDSMTYKFI